MHDKSAIGTQFLDTESRQVWARDRESGAPVYLEVGMADAMRPIARERLRCPAHGCTVLISTRGGTRRDHFFHVNSAPHANDGESQAHLGAKAMLADWLSRACLSSQVFEEYAIDTGDADGTRRADVAVVTGPRVIALEVEYKAFAANAWAAKQRGYAQAHVSCVWLLGHTRLRAADDAPVHDDFEITRVVIPVLARRWAEFDIEIVAINPRTKEIGVVTADPTGDTPLAAESREGWLHVFPLEECSFDAHRGLLTPLSVRLARTRAEAEEQARTSAAHAKAEEERQRREKANWAQIHVLFRRHEAAQHHAWESSPLHPRVMARWGSVPTELAANPPTAKAINALPLHWHAAIYEELIHQHAPLTEITEEQAVKALGLHGILPTLNADTARRAIRGFLYSLAAVGCIRPVKVIDARSRDYWVVVRPLVPKHRKQMPSSAASGSESHTSSDAATKVVQSIPRAETRANFTQSPKQWPTSVWHHAIAATYGEIPPEIIWDDVTGADAIEIPHEFWHSAIVLDLIHKHEGQSFSAEQAWVATTRAGASTLSDRAKDKVATYLVNLVQRGILDGPRLDRNMAPDSRFLVVRDLGTQ